MKHQRRRTMPSCSSAPLLSWTTLLLLAANSPNASVAWAPRSVTTITRRPTATKTTQLNSVSLNIASAMTAIDTFWQTSPYTAAAIACGVKASAADMVAQQNAAALELNDDDNNDDNNDAAFKQEESSFMTINDDNNSNQNAQPISTPETDYKRNMAFLLYGSLYQGMSQEYIYNHLYPVWFGTGQEIPVVLTKVAFDLLVQTTLVTLPMAYLIKGVLFGSGPRDSLQKYVHDIQHQGLLQKYFLLWGPVQCFTFGVVPEHYRVTFIACVSFFWLILLSKIASTDDTYNSCRTRIIETNNQVDDDFNKSNQPNDLLTRHTRTKKDTPLPL